MTRRLPLLLATALLLAGCGGTDDVPRETGSPKPQPTVTSSSTAPTSPPPTAAGTTVVVRDSEFGPMLFDSSGQAIYLFDVEKTSEARCYDACAVAWPPVLTKGSPVAGKGVDPALLGTTRRIDGNVQVTYGGHPLYFYAHEGKGEVECHDVFLNGGKWYVVQPDGAPAPA